MTRRTATLLVGGVLLVALALVIAWLPVPYAVINPGPTINTVGTVRGKPVITVSGRPTSKSAGHLNLTTVEVTGRIDLLTGLRDWLDRRKAVVPRELFFPPGRTEKQVDEANLQDFKVSENTAEIAALRELRYPLEVAVARVLPNAAASGRLKAGDVITAVDGKPVSDAAALRAQIGAKKPGGVVRVRYVRGSSTDEVTITTRPSSEDAKRAALGIQIQQRPKPPLRISFDIENIGGPSAGLMFSLGIVDLLTPAALTGGRFIAGTGAIDDQGRVGPIGGIQQKLIAARTAGATIFLTPADNCADALRRVPQGLQLVKVTSLHDALGSLARLRAGATALPSCTS